MVSLSPASRKVMYSERDVLLRDCRNWLGTARNAAELEGLAAGPETALHSAVLQSGLARAMHGCYVSSKSGSPEMNTLRQVRPWFSSPAALNNPPFMRA